MPNESAVPSQARAIARASRPSAQVRRDYQEMDKGWQASAVPSLRRPSADLDGGQYYILDESLTPQNDSLITVWRVRSHALGSEGATNWISAIREWTTDITTTSKRWANQKPARWARCYLRVRSHANSWYSHRAVARIPNSTLVVASAVPCVPRPSALVAQTTLCGYQDARWRKLGNIILESHSQDFRYWYHRKRHLIWSNRYNNWPKRRIWALTKLEKGLVVRWVVQ